MFILDSLISYKMIVVYLLALYTSHTFVVEVLLTLIPRVTPILLTLADTLMFSTASHACFKCLWFAAVATMVQINVFLELVVIPLHGINLELPRRNPVFNTSIKLCSLVDLWQLLESNNHLMDHQLARLLLPALSSFFAKFSFNKILHDIS